MSIGSPNNQANFGSSTDATSYVIGSTQTATAGYYQIAGVCNTKGATPDSPSSMTAFGLSWRTLGTVVSNANTARLTLYGAYCSSTTNALMSVDFGSGNTQTSCFITSGEFPGVDPSNSTTTQAPTYNPSGNSTQAQLTYAALTAGNVPVVYYYHGINETITVEGGGTPWTSINGTGTATPGGGVRLAYRAATDDLIPLFTAATTGAWAGIGIELAQDTGFTGIGLGGGLIGPGFVAGGSGLIG